MTDPARVMTAAIRAHALLAESHQPLTMTPGDVRTLLARYQRRLQELADAVEPITPVTGSAEADRDASALFSLRARWQGDYCITLAAGVTWSACPRDDQTVTLTASSPDELKIKLQDDYAERGHDRSGSRG